MSSQEQGSSEQKGLFLRVLLNRAHGNVSEALLKSLSKEDARAVLSHSVAETNPIPLLQQSIRTLPKLHYSWVAAALKPIDPLKRIALVACLEEEQRSGITQMFHEPTPTPISSPLLRQFYLQHLYPLLHINAHIPIEYLPESPFKNLLELKKNQIVELIDFLGLYDLAREMRQIVATKNIKNLYRCLSAKQQQFLRTIIHHKDKVVTTTLNLEKWNGEENILTQLLHKRGLMRLTAALSGQHPDLIWYLSRILDTGRGRFLEQHTKKEALSTISEALTLQVENVKHFLMENVA
jgi:hypothetical protein